MDYKRVLTFQDISCVGQCSLTVALPVISACGMECSILPSAVLSNHTGGFNGWTFRDLTEDLDGICKKWKENNISFDCVYTGYLGSVKQIELAKDLKKFIRGNGLLIVDPAMADNGVLYKGFDTAFAHQMASLCLAADIAIPNITEAAIMTDSEYLAQGYDESYILSLCRKLGTKTVVITGVSYEIGKLGIAVYHRENDKIEYYFHEKIARSSHGTGDVFASAFCGAIMRGKSIIKSAKIAADFTLASIKATLDDEGHWYGVKFEKALPELIKSLN